MLGALLDWLRGRRARRIDAATLASELSGERPPLLVDLRGPRAFAAGHLPGAVNVPAGRLARWAERLDPAGPLVLY